jgi:hypothetical protein
VRSADFAVLSIYGMALKQVGAHSEAAEILRQALALQESATLRRALQEITDSAQYKAPAHAPASVAPAQPGTLASHLDSVPSGPGTVADSDQFKGSLLHKWHRSVISFLCFWLGLGLAVAGAFYPRLLAAGALLIIWTLLRWAFTRYTVYERRIDFASGILFQHRIPVWLYDITDISMRRSPALGGKAAIDIRYESSAKKKGGQKSLVGVSSASKMREFMERLQQDVLTERRAMKKMWI